MLLPPPSSGGTETPTRSAPPTESGSWYDELFCGLSARDEQDWPRAEHHFRRATEGNPQDASAWLLLADALRQLHRYESAVAAYDVASTLAVDDIGTIFQRGMCCLAAGDYRHAVDDFTAFIERRPDVASARLNRALAYIGLNEYEQALTIWIPPWMRDCQETRGYFLRSRVHQTLGH